MKKVSDRKFLISLNAIEGLCFLCLLAPTRRAEAVPANPEPFVVQQSSNRTIQVFLRGDEFLHWHEDARGYTILRDPAKKRWVYAVKDASGQLVPSQAVVGEDDPATIGLPKRLLPDGAVNRAERLRSRRYDTPALEPTDSEPVRVPLTGTLRNLVLLVEFPDLTHTWSQEEFELLFNTVGYGVDGALGSVHDYYNEISYNTLDMESTVVDWITLDNGYAYYGGNDGSAHDLRAQEMVAEALQKLEARGFDFSAMDADNDGWVDGLTVIHAGGGEEYGGNDTNYIWSHKWSLPGSLIYDGKRLGPYHTEPERRGWDNTPSSQGITRIGVICHETGHALGLPDLYDYSGNSYGAGNFCLMAGGCWNGNNGVQPAQMSAWCKKSCTWLTPVDITESGTYSVPFIEENQMLYQLRGAFPSTQYFLVENRQGVGFDESLPGSDRGLLIWHVDETQWGNNDRTHYKVDLEEAGPVQHLELHYNQGDDADYFRDGNATTFTLNTTPNTLSYSNLELGLDVINVSTSALNMTFAVFAVDIPDAPTQLTATAVSPSRIDLSWVKNSRGDKVVVAFSTLDDFTEPIAGTSYAAGETIGPATVLYSGWDVAFEHTGLPQGTRYFYRAWSVGDEVTYSDPASASAVTFAEMPNTESFEPGFGAWINVAGDDGDWTRASGATSSSFTGPDGAHDGSYYLYTESSFGQNPGTPGKTALLDIAFDFSGYDKPELSFYYHMYGADMGSLSVDVYDGAWHLAVWSRTNQQHASSAAPWAQAVVDLSDYGSTSNVILRLRGVTGDGFTSDMAIDLMNVQALGHETHYVDRDNAAPAFPYTSWTDAATNIQDAVDAATSDDTVLVADGIYNITSEVSVAKDINLRSVNGPGVTIVDGGGETRCFNLGSSASLLSGFAIQHGSPQRYVSSGGGVYCQSTMPVVSNCVIRDNFSFLPGGGMYRGTAYDCTFSGNETDEVSGSGMTGGIAYDCTFSNNTRGGMGGGTAVNCYFSGNSGSRRAGGMTGGTAVNCTFSGNTGLYGGGMYGGSAVNCTFTDNQAGECGGGMYSSAAINCTFIVNGAYDGGGTCDCTTANCTFIGNEAEHNGGGMFGGAATNCIAVYNQAGGTGNDTHSVDAGFSCASDLPHGVNGNITNAPLMADWPNENLRLTGPSPCVNAGINGAVTVAYDLDGLPRIFDYVVDMGAYEYQEIVDSDGDLMSDGFEICYFGGKTNAVAGCDDDGDTQCNYDEYIAGMNPLDPNSCFMITAIASDPGNGFVIYWDSAPGREYSIYWSTNLVESFTLWETGIPYPQDSYTDTVHSADSNAFYDIEVQLQD